MKPLPVIFLFIFLILLSPSTCGASDDEKLTITPSPDVNLTQDIIKIDSENETVTVKPEQGVSVTSSTNESTKLSVGVQMVKDGIEAVMVDNINGLFVGAGGLQLGDLNDTEKDNSQVAIFAITAHTIDPTRDPAMMARIATMRDIYIYAIKLFAGILALFLIYQAVDPDDSAKTLEEFTGTYGYVSPMDMAQYFVKTCGWLLIGPALFFGALKINNVLVEGQMLSILDQVAFSSDSIWLYLMFGCLWLVSLLFFALRLVLIIVGAHIWILYGLGFAFKKVRWAAILATSYQIIFIFAQFAIVWLCCVVVSYTTSQVLAWYSLSFVYLGLFLAVVGAETIFCTWPIIWKLLSPQTLAFVVKIVRYL